MTPLQLRSALSTICWMYTEPSGPAKWLNALAENTLTDPPAATPPAAPAPSGACGSCNTSLSSSQVMNPSLSRSSAAKVRSISAKSAALNCTDASRRVAFTKLGASLKACRPPTERLFSFLVSVVRSLSWARIHGCSKASRALGRCFASLTKSCRKRSRDSFDRCPQPTLGGNLTEFLQIAFRHSLTSRPSNGTTPHRSWYIATPIAQTSAGSPNGFRLMTSGAMKWTVPAT
mmetsp:Transcript_56651/g.151121  ORF Transcript_56651/g.151121 Transcript_56651/m.151121 type:complete len:232 (-) Transcript_56651:669-1364(-)